MPISCLGMEIKMEFLAILQHPITQLFHMAAFACTFFRHPTSQCEDIFSAFTQSAILITTGHCSRTAIGSELYKFTGQTVGHATGHKNDAPSLFNLLFETGSIFNPK